MAGRCKVCELPPAERAAVDEALPKALADRVDDEPLRALAERHAVTMAALRRHAKDTHPPSSKASDEAAPAAPAVDPGARDPRAGAPARVTAVVAGDGWEGHADDARETPAGDSGRAWLRPRPARAELDAQVRRLTALVKDPELTLGERVRIEPILRQALSQLALVNGETKPSDMERLLLSPDFARLMDVVFRWAQRHCPAAYSQLIADLRALDAAAEPVADADLARAA